MNTGAASLPKLTLSRLVRAPRALVWQAWTDPAHLARWWGPKDFTNPRCQFEARVGGALHMDMTAPSGTVHPMNGVVWELVPQERLVFTAVALDEAGAAMFENMNTVTFEDREGGTLVTLEVAVVAIHDPRAHDHLPGMNEGWSQSLDRMVALAENPAVAHGMFTIERRFAFAPAIVFAAFSSVEAKSAWFSGTEGRWTLVHRELDFQVGGREQVIGAWTGAPSSRFDAVYHDIVPNRRIVYSYTMHLDNWLISASLATLEFRADGVGTILVMTEQGAFLNGYHDGGSREQGTKELLDKVEKALEAAARQT
jgi:uncharacterized protein YndB with AHSA1/START domain